MRMSTAGLGQFVLNREDVDLDKQTFFPAWIKNAQRNIVSGNNYPF
jgi:hypothetical protein